MWWRGERDEEEAVGDGRMSSFRLRLVSIYPLPHPPNSAAATARGRAGKEVVVGRDERKFYMDNSDVIFAALEWDKVKEWRRVEVFGGGDGRVRAQGTGEGVESVCTCTRPAAGSMATPVPMASLVHPGRGAMRGVLTRCVGLSLPLVTVRGL